MPRTGYRKLAICLAFLIALVLVAGCNSAEELPPTSTAVALLDGNSVTVERNVSSVEATSTPIPTFTPAPPPTDTPAVVAAATATTAATATSEPTEAPADTETATPETSATATATAVTTAEPTETETVAVTATEPVTLTVTETATAETVTSTATLTVTATSTETRAISPLATITATETVTTTAAMTATATSTPELLPPVLVSSQPADGATWSGGAVTFTFDQALGAESSAGLSVEPAVAGTTAVLDNRLVFTPTESLAPSTRYHFSLDQNVVSAQGTSLGGRLDVTLASPVPLQVTSTQPSDGSTDIPPDTTIVVVFNQPVVPLTGIDEQADLPQPLTIEPAVQGSGEWLNTSVFSFQPEQGLAGATSYTVVVDNIAGLSGEELAQPQIFTFTTAQPSVLGSTPTGELVPPDTDITVRFNQAMDPQSTQDAFTFAANPRQDTPTVLSGQFEWSEGDRLLTFLPDEPLAFGTQYGIWVDASAQPASQQGSLQQEYYEQFTVVPLPGVASTAPKNGAFNVPPEDSVTIDFTAPVSPTLVMENIALEPPITSTSVYSYYSPYNQRLVLNWAAEPRTTYTITLGAAIADEYGNTLGEDYHLVFTTGDRSSFTRLNVPQFTHFSAYTDTTVSVFYRNMDSLDVALYKLPEQEFHRLTGPDSWQTWRRYSVPNPDQNQLWTHSYTPTAAINEVGSQPVKLVDAQGNRLPPGFYLVQVQLPPSKDEEADTHARSLIVLSNDNLVIKKTFQGESLAWQTDLRSGEPVADQSIRFYENGERLDEASTDSDGIAAAQLALDTDQPWIALIAISGEPGDPHFAVASSAWDEGIGPWEFNINRSFDLDQIRTAFYTDRPIYRPGQTIYWKGIVRLVQNDAYQLPPQDLPVHVIVRDDRGTVLIDRDFSLNQHGTLNGQLTLADEAPTGYYSLEARINPTPDKTIYGGTSFQVAEYRKPEFEIGVTTDRSEYIQGGTISVTVQANYFSGEPLGNAPVQWRLLAEPYVFNWTDAPQGRSFRFDPVDLEESSFDPFGGFNGGLVQEGSGTTAADGSFVMEVPADLADSIRSQRWTFDVTVQSPTNQFVSGRTTVPVHRGQFYIGIGPRQYVGTAGEEMVVDVVTVTPQGAPFPDAELTSVVYDFEWNSVYEQAADGSYRWVTSVERTPVYTTTLTTGVDGMGELHWTPPQGGQYLISASGEDEVGNTINSADFVWIRAASPDAFVPWPRENNDRIELVRDKDLYEPGDTAKVLVPSPFTGPVYALVTLERSGILERSVRVLESNSETLEIPITAEHIPNVYVSVVLVKGVDETNPIPAMRLGYVQLPVDAGQKELSLDIQPSAPRVKPGDTLTYTLTISDSSGAPVSDAEVSVALIDKAVLSLATGGDSSLLDRFYYQQPLGVATGALLVINQDRVSQQVSEGGKGGGGGGPGGGLEIRQDFADVAYWRADLETDVDGHITFSVDLPDNLTTWRLVARAVSDETLVGDATNDVVATKDLLIRPILPRFFTAGDRAKIGAVVQNTTNQDLGEAHLTMQMEGAQFATDRSGGQQEAAFELGPSGQHRFEQLVEVGADQGSVVVTYTVQAGEYSDAVRMTLPVERYETPEVVGTSGTVPPEGRLEAIVLPEAATDNGELLVTVEPSLAAGMLDGLTYLRHFPYECNEQTVSRFLPNLFTVRALHALDLSKPELETDLAFQLGVGLQRLVNRQNPDGGWGWWAGNDSNVFITAYVLWGLWSADSQGYTVPQDVMNRAAGYLTDNFQAPADVKQTWKLNEMAFVHFVLSEMGEGDPGRASTLYDVRERLGIYGQAYLAMALANIAENEGTSDDRVQNLLDSLVSQIHLSATGAFWQEEETDWWTMNSDTRTTSVALAAFARLRPDYPLLPSVVRWLMSARQAGRWASTQENAWAIIGLTDWMVATGELNADYSWQVTLNGDELGSGEANAETLADPVQLRADVADLLRDEANALRLNRSNDTGQLYYTTHLRYYLDATAIPARDRGLIVSRTIQASAGDNVGETVTSAAVGDVLSVTVTLVAPTDMHYLQVEVPIPAGTEPIDTSLATTSEQFGAPQFGLEEESSSGQQPDRYWWRYWVPSHTDLRDEKVALFADYVPAGTYEYTFQVRASLPGEYRVLPVHAEEMYFPEVWGRSSGGLFTVTE